MFCIHVLFKTPPPMPLLLRCIFLLLWSCFLKFFKPWLLINKKVLILMKSLIPYFYFFLSSLRNLYQFIFSSRKFIIFLIYLGPWPTWNYFCECNMRKLLRYLPPLVYQVVLAKIWQNFPTVLPWNFCRKLVTHKYVDLFLDSLLFLVSIYVFKKWLFNCIIWVTLYLYI